MAVKLTRLIHKIAIQLHLVAAVPSAVLTASPETPGYTLVYSVGLKERS